MTGAASPGPAPLLLTGFEPFGGETVNPSWQVAQALHGTQLHGVPVVALQLPCVFGQALTVLREALQRLQPQVVLALGQAGGRCDLSLERVAINVDDARIADNAGAQPVDEPVVAGGPAAYFATLPIKAMVAALRAAGFPASVSQTAGTFVCNHVFYGLMHALQGQGGIHPTHPVRGGFMHVPLLPEQAARHPGQPSLPLATLVDGTRLALATALAVSVDVRLGGGAVS
jgi:pyroglutamyl-peptidase